MPLVDTPIFLVGSMRSGTTLLRLMLDNHPRIAFNLETVYIVSEISDDGRFPELQHFRDWLRNDRSFKHSRFIIDEKLDYVGLVNDFLHQKKVRDNKDIVGATIHHHFRMLPGIWPRAKYIYLYRDGRDVANSVMRMGWAGNVYHAADWWLRTENEWAGLQPSLDRSQWIEVRYEDLILHTKPQLERLCAFVGVEYSEEMLSFSKRSTYDAPDTSLIYQWKTGVSVRDIQLMEAKMGQRLLQRGYELSGHPRLSMSGLASSYLDMDSRIRRYFARIRQFGPMLALQETLSRRFGLKRWHLDATKRIDAIIDANLK